MSNTERHRKRLALLLAVMVLVLTCFISTVGNSAIRLYSYINDTEEYAQEQIEAYKDLTLEINDTFLNTVESDWNIYSQHIFYQDPKKPPDYYIKEFSESFLKPVSENAFMSVIVTTSDGEVLTRHHQKEEYEEIVIDFSKVPADREVAILNGDPDKPFGEGERYYIAGTRLQFEDVAFNVYFGYLEPVMMENFVNALNLDILESIKKHLEYITYTTVIMLLFSIIYGMYLMYYTRKVKIIIYKDIIEECEQEENKEE